MFKWTNVYNGTYELAEWREMWKYSHGFHLYTDYSVTLQLQYLRSALIKAWFKMGIGRYQGNYYLNTIGKNENGDKSLVGARVTYLSSIGRKRMWINHWLVPG